MEIYLQIDKFTFTKKEKDWKLKRIWECMYVLAWMWRTDTKNNLLFHIIRYIFKYMYIFINGNIFDIYVLYIVICISILPSPYVMEEEYVWGINQLQNR